MKELLSAAKAVYQETVAHRRFLHEHAEVGFDLPQTTDYIYEKLKEYGYQPKKLDKGGVIAEILPKDGGREGFILLRADVDALKVKEESGLSFACKSGRMHACGHDMHAASLLGAAKILQAQKEKLHRPVRLLFQPAEEILQGGKYAIDCGVTEGVACAFALHVLSGAEVPVGKVACSAAGVSAPSADMFEIEIKGKGCHGAMPHEGVDALAPAVAVWQALQGIVAREIPVGEGLLTVGSLQSGESGNVISDRALLKGSCRAFEEPVRAFIKRRIDEIAKNIAKGYRARAKVRFFGGCPALLQDKKLLEKWSAALGKTLGEDKVSVAQTAVKKISASEDFAYISEAVPSLLVSVSAAQNGGGYPLHHPKVIFEEEALLTAVAAYATVALT